MENMKNTIYKESSNATNKIMDWIEDNITSEGLKEATIYIQNIFEKILNCILSISGMIFLFVLFWAKTNILIPDGIAILILPTIILLYVIREKYGVLIFDTIYLIGSLYLVPQLTGILLKYDFIAKFVTEYHCDILKLVFIVLAVIEFMIRVRIFRKCTILNKIKKIK